MPEIRCTVGDKVFTLNDLTLDEAVEVERDTGETWNTMNPFRSAVHARAILRVLALRENTNEDVGALTVAASLDRFEYVDEDDLPDLYEDGIPKAVDAPATNGSSGAPNATDGNPTKRDAKVDATSTS